MNNRNFQFCKFFCVCVGGGGVELNLKSKIMSNVFIKNIK